MDNLFSVENLTALFTLSLMEIVLGIDNIIFIAILTSRLPKEQQPLARNLGISMALLTRLLLLFSISWVMGLSDELFRLMGQSVSGRDLILVAGGLFLIAKATYEIHQKMEDFKHGEEFRVPPKKANFSMLIMQIMVLDIVFSLDSVITAVGMAKNLTVMVIAMVIAMLTMLLSAGSIGHFVEKHPSIKILALSFLILIGVMLMVEGMHQHVSKGYVYFAMFFSLFVELINMRVGTRKA